MAFINKNELVDIFREGLFQEKPTVVAATVRQIEGSPDVLLILVDPIAETQRGKCLASDIPLAIEEFEEFMKRTHRDPRIPNPNLAELSKAFDHARKFQEGICAVLRTESKFRTRQTLTVVEGRPLQ